VNKKLIYANAANTAKENKMIPTTIRVRLSSNNRLAIRHHASLSTRVMRRLEPGVDESVDLDVYLGMIND
jgi:hypothetical protein